MQFWLHVLANLMEMIRNYLIFVWIMVDRKLRHEIRNQSVSSESGNVRTNYGKHLAQKWLDESIESANLESWMRFIILWNQNQTAYLSPLVN